MLEFMPASPCRPEQIPAVIFGPAEVRGNHARASAPPSRDTRDYGAAGGRVMLHLRSRYVSKAAIFMIMVSSIPIENRSPA